MTFMHPDRVGTRMTVGELSRLTGVPVKTLREYTDLGLIYTLGRSPANYRLYNGDALWCVRFIGELRGLGLTVAEIRELTAARADGAGRRWARTWPSCLTARASGCGSASPLSSRSWSGSRGSRANARWTSCRATCAGPVIRAAAWGVACAWSSRQSPSVSATVAARAGGCCPARTRRGPRSTY
ncbi:MerR family transcriptional regulator [Streptomyces ardesiacus]|uniref:MerR family transcriptional regulator n=1 Tax=Streptomyces ardesiacus TaxID=285564 RepID=UPI000A9005CD|nr:MerR family transcriptional regulator [Streptomyces sp. NBRC 110030]